MRKLIRPLPLHTKTFLRECCAQSVNDWAGSIHRFSFFKIVVSTFYCQ